MTWETDLSANRVLAAVMQVSGCGDRTVTDLELLLDGAPPQALPTSRLLNGTATFDLRALNLGIEAVTGVRVAVQGVAVDLPPTPGRPTTPRPGATPPTPIGGVVDQPASGGSPSPTPHESSLPSPAPTAAGTATPSRTPPARPGERGITPAPVALPFTGVPLISVTSTGLVLMLSGVVALLLARRRRRPLSGAGRSRP